MQGATKIIAIDSNPVRLEKAKMMGADVVINFKEKDPISEINRLTSGRGVDVALECLGLQSTFESESLVMSL